MTDMDEWVEVRGKTVEDAVEVGLAELGLDSSEAAEIEVLQEPQRGFLGFGGQDALVRIKPRPKRRRRRRRARGPGEVSVAAGRGSEREKTAAGGKGRRPRERRSDGREKAAGRSGRAGNEAGVRRDRPDSAKGEDRRGGAAAADTAAPTVSVDEQAAIVRDFLEGLLQAFGLEGEVSTRVDGDIIYADVSGEQTEALVGAKGAILDAVLELCRTMVHRQSQAGARLRLDIAGYGERRREALRIYAARLATKVLEEGGEVMLEPMNAADRKVVHDAVAEIQGVRTFSEGEEPDRSVVIARVEED